MEEVAAYNAFIATKRRMSQYEGIDREDIVTQLFPFQKELSRRALAAGRYAVFADCGLGKTAIQLDVAANVHESTGRPVLILAPLAVTKQTATEGERFGVRVAVCRSQQDICDSVNIANYDMMHKFDPSVFGGIILDESSILKNFAGAMRTALIDGFSNTPYRFCFTATPSPNDHTELGNHSEFLGVETRTNMLSTYFVHDSGRTSDWRLKGHAESEFWRWIGTWATVLRNPADIGFDGSAYVLPPLNIIRHRLVFNYQRDGEMFSDVSDLSDRRAVRRESLGERVDVIRSIVADSAQTIIWCELNAEQEAILAALPYAIGITGSDKPEDKESRVLAFAQGSIRTLVTKASIAGFGVNWQSCSRVVFVGLSDSYERFYQAVRRCWRFGNPNQVDVHILHTDAERTIIDNIERKERDIVSLYDNAVHTIEGLRENPEYEQADISGANWRIIRGDCVRSISEKIESQSIDFSIFSPPFADLYTYSAVDEDFGNTRNHDEFIQQFSFLVDELARIMKPGRIVAVHCMLLPTFAFKHGVIGLYDFRGDIIRAFTGKGFVYHSEVTIWKDPVTAMQRTKSIRLLYKQLKKDSCMSGQGIADYLCVFRTTGKNPEPVTKTPESFPVDRWQNYASPVWMDIDQGRTLQRESAREDEDERHICPLQLDVIERAITLWTNPNDVVLSPFAGIGSEVVSAVKMGRRAIGIELKPSYFQQMKANVENAGKQLVLFS